MRATAGVVLGCALLACGCAGPTGAAAPPTVAPTSVRVSPGAPPVPPGPVAVTLRSRQQPDIVAHLAQSYARMPGVAEAHPAADNAGFTVTFRTDATDGQKRLVRLALNNNPLLVLTTPAASPRPGGGA